MIMGKYGGPNGIMSALYTNIKVGISSLFLNKYRPVSTTLRMTRRIEPEYMVKTNSLLQKLRLSWS